MSRDGTVDVETIEPGDELPCDPTDIIHETDQSYTKGAGYPTEHFLKIWYITDSRDQ